ncbi:MAG: glycosyltransferase, partial [Desulfobacterota bacterium]|nr:glycosyltransferase [Thermodesulfobacteriota bacterium]
NLFLREKPIRIVTRRVDFSIFRHNFLGMSLYKYTKGIDHIIAISQKVKDVLTRDGVPSRNISIVPDGVDVNRFRGIQGDNLFQEFLLPSDSLVLVNIAFLVGHKGQKYLIQAMAQVAQEFPNIHLFILGEGYLKEELTTLTAKLGLAQHITFTGFRDDVGAFLSICKLLVVSSIEEGLNSTILDALALEIPVVATEAGGIPEIINKETGVLVPPADPKALASGISWVLKNYDKAKEMAKKGKMKVIEEFSADSMVEGNLQVYQKIIFGRGADDALHRGNKASAFVGQKSKTNTNSSVFKKRF